MGSPHAPNELTLPPEQFIEESPGIYRVETLLPVITPSALVYNVNAADTTNTDQLRTGGGLGLNLTGTGVTVGVWDGGGIRQSHTEFNNGNRVTVIDNAPLLDHSTHVAGTIGARGADANARGMGSAILLRSRDATNDAAELATDAAIIDLSNHSYGYLRGWTDRVTWRVNSQDVAADTWVADRIAFAGEDPLFGKYTNTASPQDAALGIDLVRPRQLDDLLFNNAELLGIWAAGNDRTNQYQGLLIINGVPGYFAYSGTQNGYRFFSALTAPPQDGNVGAGYDTLPQSQVAKNTLVVGAVDDVLADPYGAGNIVMSAFSDWGPTDDGRIKRVQSRQ